MDNNESRQEFFISDDGYINIRLKVETEDSDEREKLVHDLMGAVYKGNKFKIPKGVSIDQMYFHNQNPLTVLKSLKEEMIKNIESVFDESINRSSN